MGGTFIEKPLLWLRKTLVEIEIEEEKLFSQQQRRFVSLYDFAWTIKSNGTSCWRRLAIEWGLTSRNTSLCSKTAPIDSVF